MALPSGFLQLAPIRPANWRDEPFYVPPEWDVYSYSNQRFVRIALKKTSLEYKEIQNEFLEKYAKSYVTVRSIERIQHPFAYGEFRNRKEQLIADQSGQSPKENRIFLSITDANKIDIVIEFNCDLKRGGFSHASQTIGTGYVLVVKMLGDNFDEPDTYHFPEYLIEYQDSRFSMALPSGILQSAVDSTVPFYIPPEWDVYSYSNQRFVRIALKKTSLEYKEIQNEFLEKYATSYVTVQSIERIQHPFAYRGLLNRKEQLTVLHRQSPKVNRTFLSITDANKADIVIEFNCDHRRGGFNHDSQLIGTGYVLVVKMLGDSFDERDTYHYPEYLIQYQSSTSRSRNVEVFFERVDKLYRNRV